MSSIKEIYVNYNLLIEKIAIDNIEKQIVVCNLKIKELEKEKKIIELNKNNNSLQPPITQALYLTNIAIANANKKIEKLKEEIEEIEKLKEKIKK